MSLLECKLPKCPFPESQSLHGLSSHFAEFDKTSEDLFPGSRRRQSGAFFLSLLSHALRAIPYTYKYL